MRIRNLDSSGDWTFGQSNSDYVKKEYAIKLAIETKLKEWYGDCFFAMQNGIPWEVRLGDKNQKDLLDEDIIRIVRSVEGVLDIIEFKSQIIPPRRYQCQFNIYTIYSTQPNTITYDTMRG